MSIRIAGKDIEVLPYRPTTSNFMFYGTIDFEGFLPEYVSSRNCGYTNDQPIDFYVINFTNPYTFKRGKRAR